jgi:tight adherence protein C
VTPELVLFLGVAGVFLAFVLALGTIGAITAERQQVGRSLAAVRAVQSAPANMRRDLERPFGERVIGPTLNQLTRLGRRLTPTDHGSRVRRRLDLAGNPLRWDVDRVIAFKMLGALALGVLGLAMPLALGASIATTLVVAVAAIAFGYFLPNIVLYQVGYTRMQRMRRELPDALDLLTISVEAGLAFDAALSQVARNTEGPLAEEFFRVLQEMHIGLGRVEALRALSDRSDLPELRTFIGAVVQAEAFGIPIAHVLRVQAREMRIKRSQRAEEMAQKVPVKILFPLIFCIMPALFVVIIGPAAISIARSFVGS